MAWAGDDEDDELNCTPIEEILAVTREDQEMLTEAHKALRREIKSIRRALKKLVRQFYTYADAQESTAPEWSDVSSVAESDIQISKDNQDADSVLDFTTDNEYKQDENIDQKIINLSEALQNIEVDEVESQRQRSFSCNAENGHVDNNDTVGNRRRPESTPPKIGNNNVDVSPQRFSPTQIQRRHSSRSSETQLIAKQTTSTRLPERQLSRNSNGTTETHSAAADEDTIFMNLDSEQFNKTYPGASVYQTTSQNTATKSLRQFGRRDAQHQLSSNVLKDQSKSRSPNSPGLDNDDDQIQQRVKSQLTDLPPNTVSEQLRRPPPLQRRFTQEEIRHAGSQLRFPSTRQIRPLLRRKDTNQQLEQVPEKSSHPSKQIDEPPPSIPPPPPPEDIVELPGMEDQLGEIPEFSNSFQALPRRLSSSEISAIGGGEKRSNHMARVKKLIRTSSHSISVAQHAQVAT
ncbi:uncharacterized protein [Amphiura filiformis]|uniref:uncharacterized protein n=1 Tax=Amphiura filiformis TaxID=82378 RepID=UPI003B214629